MKEFILCAAILHGSIVIPGRRHSDCYDLLARLVPDLPAEQLPDNEHQGFLTSKNRYVNRQDGWDIALANNQIEHGLIASTAEEGERSILISENLY